MQLVIDTDKMEIMSMKADKAMLTPEADNQIVALMYIRWLADKYIEHAKQRIVEEGEKIMPNFKGYIGDKVNGTYRYFGSKYTITDSQLAEGFTTKKVSYTPNVEAIDQYVEVSDELPQGIDHAQRTKTLTLNTTEVEKLFEEGYKPVALERGLKQITD